MFTLDDIKRIKFEMEEEGLLTCSDMFMEELKKLDDKKDELSKQDLLDSIKYDADHEDARETF